MKTERIVSKKELQDFKDKYGQENELRDLLNKEKGLTRRRDAKDKLKSPGMNPAEYASSGKAMVDKQDEEAKLDKLNSSYRPRRSSTLSDVVKPGTNTNYENTENLSDMSMKRGGKVKKMAHGGVTRADGIAQRGKTKGRMV